jgi:hypothetical protein
VIGGGAGCQWLVPIILATQEAKNRRMKVQSPPGQKVGKTFLQNNKHK